MLESLQDVKTTGFVGILRQVPDLSDDSVHFGQKIVVYLAYEEDFKRMC